MVLAVTTYEYDDVYRLTKVTYPKDKIEQIRAKYYTPPQEVLHIQSEMLAPDL